MTQSPPIPISIIRAAAMENDTITTLPPNLSAPADSPPPEPLADPFLRLAHILLADLSPTIRQSTGIILGTPHGCLQADWEFDRSRRESAGRYASPAAFSRTLPSTIPAELSVKLGLHGPLLTLSADNHSTATALHRAISWMRHLNFHWCLTGGFDTGTTPTPHPRAAFLLLSTIPAPALAKIEPSNLRASDSPPLTTDSLSTLITWIQQSTQPNPSKTLSLGPVQLVRT